MNSAMPAIAPCANYQTDQEYESFTLARYGNGVLSLEIRLR